MPTMPASRPGGESTINRFSARRTQAVIGFLLVVALVLALGIGTYAIDPLSILANLLDIAASAGAGLDDRIAVDAQVLLSIRLPRLLLAAMSGASLALCGAVMQGLFRNPLADPSLIGVTSGASAGASCAIVAGGIWAGQAGAGLPSVAVGAFVGGLLTTLLVYRLATTTSGTSVATMLLAGIAIGALAGALNSLSGFVGDNDMLRRISLWQMGNLTGADWRRVALMSTITLLLVVLLPRDSQALNAMLLGESEARYLGIEVQWLKRRLILLTALGVGITVAVAGALAFVGLMVPHLIRLLIGPDHRQLLPASALAGALLLVIADTFARTIIAPAEMPTGIVTALLGAPFFVWLLYQQRRQLAAAGG